MPRVTRPIPDPTDSEDIDHDQTQGGDEGTPHDHANPGDPQPPEEHGDTEHDATVSSQSDLNDHETSSSDVHGVGGSNVESEAGAQSKVNDHENKSNPHGVTTDDTGALPESDYNPEADTHNPPTGTQDAEIVAGFTSGDESGSLGSSGDTVDITYSDYGDAIKISISVVETEDYDFEIINDGEVIASFSAGSSEPAKTFNVEPARYGTFTVKQTSGSNVNVSLGSFELNILPLPAHNHEI